MNGTRFGGRCGVLQIDMIISDIVLLYLDFADHGIPKSIFESFYNFLAACDRNHNSI